jgi:ribonuclease P protein component
VSADARFSKTERLRKRREYLAVQRRGKRFVTGLFVLLWAPGPCPWPRLGITASRKVGGAVARNRAKRLVREAFRRNKERLPPRTDLVIIASPTLPRAPYADVERALLAWATSEARRRDGHREPTGKSEPKTT